jgi:hypothetical protein
MAIGALKAHRINCVVRYMKDRVINARDLYIGEQLRTLNVPVRPYELFPDGRGRLLPEVKSNRVTPKDEVLRRPCGLSHQIVILHDGEVARCCTAPYFSYRIETNEFYNYGSIREGSLSDILNRTQEFDAISAILAREGPGGVYRRLKNVLHARGFRLKDLYYNQCELCSELFGKKRYLEIIK